jgi:transcriptional regulator with XRE-family HTH domain
MPMRVPMAKKKQIRINEILPALLKESGMNMSELSRATSIPVSTIATWLEEGARPSDVAAVALCAEALSTTMHHLLFGSPEREPSLDDLPTEMVMSGYYRLRLEKVIHSPRKKKPKSEDDD